LPPLAETNRRWRIDDEDILVGVKIDMLVGDKGILRGIRRDDLPRLWEFNNDVAVELAGGGEPPFPRRWSDFRRSSTRKRRKAGAMALASRSRPRGSSSATVASAMLIPPHLPASWGSTSATRNTGAAATAARALVS
jgi:hypothetical protein